MKARFTFRLFPLGRFLIAVNLCIIFLLSACGGGGGGDAKVTTVASSVISSSLASSSTSSSIFPAPTLIINNTELKLKIGETSSISIASTNATSCSEPVLGAIAVNGSVDITSTKGGRVTYTISCIGDGGVVTKDVLVVTPIPVQKSSYLNKNNIEAAPVSFREFNKWDSALRITGILSSGESVGSANGLADFEQNGTFVFLTNIFNAATSNGVNFGDAGYIPINGDFLFLKRTETGWVDITDKLLPGNKAGCVHARKMLIADFNNDEKPDAFIACHGYDFAAGDSPYHGESAHILLSQTDGTYINSEVVGTERAYAHGASAADINGDGNVDVVLADIRFEGCNRPIRFLMGRGDGTFITDTSRIPLTYSNYNSCAFWTAELIDIDGSELPGLFIGGSEQNSMLLKDKIPTLIFNNINGYYSETPTLVPPLEAVGNLGNIALDFVVLKNSLYVLRTMEAYTGGSTVQRMDLNTLQSTTIYSHTGSYEIRNAENVIIGGSPSTWIDFMTIRNGHIVSVDSDFGLDLTP